MAAPMILAGVLINLGMGALGRLVPSLPVMFVALPLQLLVAFLILRCSLPAALHLFDVGLRPAASTGCGRAAELAEETEHSQKTEAPSQRRLEEARAKGQLVVSREVGTFLLFGAAAILAAAAAPAGARAVARVGAAILADASTIAVDGPGLTRLGSGLLAQLGWPVLCRCWLSWWRRSWRRCCRTPWSGPPSRSSPSSSGSRRWPGARRLFSARSLVELGKSLAKLAMVAGALGWLLWPELPRVIAADGLAVGPFAALLADSLTRTLTMLAAVALVVAGADYGHQHAEFMRRMRMSRQEVLDELKQSDGDPHTKQRLRAHPAGAGAAADDRRRAAGDGGVTNPTHYAVALRYVVGETAAPEVLAKGVDTLALKIRKIAAENGDAGDRERPARPRAACSLRPRRRDPARALPGGGRGDLLRPSPGRAVAAGLAVPRCSAAPISPEREVFIHRRNAGCSGEPLRADRGGPSMERLPVRSMARATIVAAVAGFAAAPALATSAGLFGTAEYRTESLAELPQWQGVLRRMAAEAAITAACREAAGPLPEPRHPRLVWRCSAPSTARRRGRSCARSTGSSTAGPTAADADNYDRSDYWATPLEFFRRSGDCEDYVIAKYRSLRLLGLPAEQLRMVVVQDVVRGLPHAVLAVYLADEVLILDNLSDDVLPQARIRNYLPYYSVNETSRWAHAAPDDLPLARAVSAGTSPTRP